MSTNNNTVVSLKSAFLRNQTRILSQPLQAPERWRLGNSNAAEIPERVVKDVIREGVFQCYQELCSIFSFHHLIRLVFLTTSIIVYFSGHFYPALSSTSSPTAPIIHHPLPFQPLRKARSNHRPQ